MYQSLGFIIFPISVLNNYSKNRLLWRIPFYLVRNDIRISSRGEKRRVKGGGGREGVVVLQTKALVIKERIAPAGWRLDRGGHVRVSQWIG